MKAKSAIHRPNPVVSSGSESLDWPLLIVGHLLVWASLFPYIRVLPISTDIQPNALLVGCMVIFLGLKSIRRVPIGIFVFIAAAILASFIPGGALMHKIRGAASAASFGILFVAWAVVPTRIVERILNPLTFLVSTLIYLLGVMIQRYINPDALTIFMSREEGYGEIGGRGNESFAAEPTFLAIHMLLMMYVGFRFFRSGWLANLFYVISLVVIVWGAKSSTAMLVLAIFIAAYCLCLAGSAFYTRFTLSRMIQIWTFVLLGVVAGAGAWHMASEQESRFGVLLSKLLRGGVLSVIVEDASVADRYAHIWISFKESLRSYLVPNGYGVFYWRALESLAGTDLAAFLTGSGHGRVMSCYGGLLFELGIFGLIPITYLSRSLFPRPISVAYLATGGAMSLLLLQAVPVSHPMLAIIAALFLHRQNRVSFRLPPHMPEK